MAFSVVLDANVLYPASLRDTLLRFASRDFFVPVSSSLWCDPPVAEKVALHLIQDPGRGVRQ
ncbi:hypothetical protein [Paraconexibacter algicola]|uniref:PIN domain-containing protein n=1 Tax=Paraconexibacter algicola TaxID=2133960 RepID=A0A2T4UL78_9ACTN|nr:hypothetical protein [Paraconexibacter algicola]PTL59958.1 hypothetical protein C7Y72_10025 [Paraconexibacter algicola]